MRSGDFTKTATYFDTSSPENCAIFWSGNKEGAMDYAITHGGIIMEQTPGGQVFDGWRGLEGMYPEWDTGTVLDQKPIWNAMSAQYAKGAVGDITYIHTLDEFGNPYYGKVWLETELPIVQQRIKNTEITGVREVILDGKQ